MSKAFRSLRLWSLVACLCSVLPCLGQMSNFTYAGASTVSVQPNLFNCTTQNCWHPSSITTQMVASVNGFTVVASSNPRKIYLYNDYPTDSYTELTNLENQDIGDIAVATQPGGSVIYSLKRTVASNGEIYYSSAPYTSWTPLPSKPAFIRVYGGPADGSIMALTGTLPPNGYQATAAYTWANGAYNLLATTPNGFKDIAPIAGGVDFIGVDTQGQLFNCTSTCTAFSPALPTGTVVDHVSADAGGNILVSTGTTPGCNCPDYYYSQGASSWNQINTGSGYGGGRVANGGSMEAWIIGPASNGNSVYRLIDQTLVHTRTLTGTATCPNNNCQGATHTGTVQAGWTVKGTQVWGGQNTTGAVNPQYQMNISSNSWMDDPFECFGAQANCWVNSSGNVNCTIMGTIYSDNPPPNSGSIVAFTRGKITGTNPRFYGGADYTLTDYCSGTSKPEWSFDTHGTQHGPYFDGNPALLYADHDAICIQFFNVCPFSKVTGWYTYDPGPGNCTPAQ